MDTVSTYKINNSLQDSYFQDFDPPPSSPTILSSFLININLIKNNFHPNISSPIIFTRSSIICKNLISR